MSLKGLLMGSCMVSTPLGMLASGSWRGLFAPILELQTHPWLGVRLTQHRGSDPVGPGAPCFSLPPGLASLLVFRAALSPFRGSSDRFLASFLSPGFLKCRCETDSQVFGRGGGENAVSFISGLRLGFVCVCCCTVGSRRGEGS